MAVVTCKQAVPGVHNIRRAEAATSPRISHVSFSLLFVSATIAALRLSCSPDLLLSCSSVGPMVSKQSVPPLVLLFPSSREKSTKGVQVHGKIYFLSLHPSNRSSDWALGPVLFVLLIFSFFLGCREESAELFSR
ncbi:unnamed protein product [Laminaria digitata]